jgi:anti-anti-sigma regulatory factor
MGLGALAIARKTAGTRHGAVVTVGMQPQIAKVFEIMKMLPKESIFTTLAEADSYLAAIQKQVVEGNS